eukprot:6189138-Pleurochrysis_carterae.AAC.1
MRSSEEDGRTRRRRKRFSVTKRGNKAAHWEKMLLTHLGQAWAMRVNVVRATSSPACARLTPRPKSGTTECRSNVKRRGCCGLYNLRFGQKSPLSDLQVDTLGQDSQALTQRLRELLLFLLNSLERIWGRGHIL